MRHRAEQGPLVGADRHHEDHIRQALDAVGQLEVITHLFFEHGRRERAIALALLDHRVDARPVVGRTRVGEDAAIAQRARPEFRAALHPSDHRAAGEERRGHRARIVDALGLDERRPAGEGRANCLAVTKVAADEEVREDRWRDVRPIGTMRVERGADRGTGVVRGGMHEHPLEQTGPEDFSVHRRVVRHAARQAEVRLSGRSGEVPQHVEHDRLERLLQGGREVLVDLGEWFVILPRREDGVQDGDAAQEQREGAVGLQLVELAEEPAKPFGIAIGREAHHLVFLEHVVAEEANDLAVQVPSESFAEIDRRVSNVPWRVRSTSPELPSPAPSMVTVRQLSKPECT